MAEAKEEMEMRMCGEHKCIPGKLISVNTVVKLNSNVKKLGNPKLQSGDVGYVVGYDYPHHVVNVAGQSVYLTKSYFKVVR